MPSGADLFVVCKQCGSEVSPYVTECPYCGHRLRRRAPKLPRMQAQERAAAARPRLSALIGRRQRRGRLAVVDHGYGSGRWEATRPYATILLVALAVAAWVLWHAWPDEQPELVIAGPLHGEWWRLLSYSFVYGNGVYAFITLVAIAIFGWLLERRHGPVVVVALYLAATIAGGLVALAVYSHPLVTGGNAGALALLAAWAAPDVRAARTGAPYEGDLLGTGVVAGLVIALPFALQPIGVEEFHLIGSAASWLAGLCGGVIGLLAGTGLGGRSALAE
ncbi:MAG TPA: rhomboid family intramembrane serine protease [Solirubrobacteraceae bacterium]|nr:rhomboid family intramembrane serine protease [Solirubrobacteraceae bacterium]